MARAKAGTSKKKASSTRKSAKAAPVKKAKAAPVKKAKAAPVKKAKAAPVKAAAEAPKKAAEVPKKAAEAPKPVAEVPKQAAEVPKPVAEAPKKAAEVPKKAAAVPKKAPVKKTAVKKAVEITKRAAELPKKAVELAKHIAEPRKRAAEKAPQGQRTAASGAANDDIPSAPTGYRVDFAGRRWWPSVVVGEHTFAGDPGRAPLAEAGKPLFVAYGRSAEDLGHRGGVTRAELYYRFADGGVRMLPVTSPVLRIDVPARAFGELQLWFRLLLDDGRILWDSDFGRNHRVEIVPAGEIWVLFEGERRA